MRGLFMSTTMSSLHANMVIILGLLVMMVVPECMAYNRGPEPVIQETPVPSTPPPPTLPPCRPKGGATVSDIKRHMMMTHNKVKVTGNDVIGRTYNWKTEVNCTEGDGTSVEPVEYDHWKLHIIMACTVTAAVEFVLIIFIILYWKQIRWTLRKLTCPCVNCRQHEAMEPEEIDEQETHDIDIVEMGVSSRSHGRGENQRKHRPHRDHMIPEPMVQTFSPPWNSRVQSGDELEDVAVAGPSGLNSVAIVRNSVPFQSLDRKFSSSDDSLSGDERCHVVAPVSPSTKPPLRVKSSKRQSNCSKLSEPSDSGICPSVSVHSCEGEQNPGSIGLDTTYNSHSVLEECKSRLDRDTVTCPLGLKSDRINYNQTISMNIHDRAPTISKYEDSDDSLISVGENDDFKLTNQGTVMHSQSDADKAELNLVHTAADVHCESTGVNVSPLPSSSTV